MQRKGVSKDWVQEVLKQQRRDAWNLNQYISRKAKTLPVLERLGSVTDLFLLMARGSKSWEQLQCCRGFYHTAQNGARSYNTTILQDVTWWKKNILLQGDDQDMCRASIWKKISFANALLELYLSGREGEEVHALHLLPALAKWESWHALSPLRWAGLPPLPTSCYNPTESCVWKQEPWALISDMQVSTLKPTPDTDSGCSLNTGTHSDPNTSHLCFQNGIFPIIPAPVLLPAQCSVCSHSGSSLQALGFVGLDKKHNLFCLKQEKASFI